MIKSVTIIGAGSIGGYLCKHLCYKSNIEKIQVIDSDIVEKENIDGSIYQRGEEGVLKVDALKKRFGDKIYPVNSKYKDGKKGMIQTDIIVDCSDKVAQFYTSNLSIYVVTGKNVIFDCRKITENDIPYHGRYVDLMTITELDMIGQISAQFVYDGLATDMYYDNHIYSINIPYIENRLKQIGPNFEKRNIDAIWSDESFYIEYALSELERSKEIYKRNHEDIIYSLEDSDGMINGITTIRNPIFKENKIKDIDIRYYENFQKKPIYTKTIEKGTFKNKYGVGLEIMDILDMQIHKKMMVAVLTNRYDNVSIDLFPLTKGA